MTAISESFIMLCPKCGVTLTVKTECHHEKKTNEIESQKRRRLHERIAHQRKLLKKARAFMSRSQMRHNDEDCKVGPYITECFCGLVNLMGELEKI
jgi:hypothetical protein